MSLIDPSTRWWNRYGVRRTASWVCWTAAVVLALIGGWAVTGALGDAGASAAWVVPVVYTLGLLLLLGGTFLWLFGREIEHFEPRPMLMPIVALLGAQGLGEIAHAVVEGVDPQVVSIVLAAVGVVGLVAIELIARRLVANEFVDTQGRSRWIGTTLSGRLAQDAPVRVRYLPDELDRKAAVIVTRL